MILIDNKKLEIRTDSLSPVTYLEFHRVVGFKKYAFKDVQIALKRDILNVEIVNNNEPIAIGRLIGDGKITFFLKDIIVLPEYQGQGIGSYLVTYLLNYIKKNGSSGAYIGLMSTKGNERFYSKFGFIERPNDEFGSGMIMFND